MSGRSHSNAATKATLLTIDYPLLELATAFLVEQPPLDTQAALLFVDRFAVCVLLWFYSDQQEFRHSTDTPSANND